MLVRLFDKMTARQRPPAAVPPGTRAYAIGDVHGRVDLLRALHQLIRDDAAARRASRNLVVYLGDYIDRGEDSAKVIDCLLDERLPGFAHVHLLGNHEDSLVQFVRDIQIGPAWLAYGGAATLRSYGVAPPVTSRDLIRAQAELRAALPKRHLDFMRNLPLCHVEGDYYFVHAGIRPSVKLAAQQPQDLLWIRDEFLSSTADFGKIVVHGHTITETPELRRNRIGIDTGAFASGHLTCLVLQDQEVAFLQT
jgi:serine/threonine protein phosphatase 1